MAPHEALSNLSETPVSLHVRTNKFHSAVTKTIALFYFVLLPSLGLAQQQIDVALVLDGTPDRLEARSAVLWPPDW
jgi:hypothetical protein